jgi:hypothetical protein
MVEAEADKRISGQPVKFHSVVAGFADPKRANGEAIKSRVHFGEKTCELVTGQTFHCGSETALASL